MKSELIANFDSLARVSLRYKDRVTPATPFEVPLSPEIRERLRWYLEVYPAEYTTDIDDESATRIKNSLAKWGQMLHRSLFGTGPSLDILRAIEGERRGHRVLTIASRHSEIHSLPWEILTSTAGGFLCLQHPTVSVRRSLSGTPVDRAWQPKKKVRVLYIISRPFDVDFIDSISDPEAIIDAVGIGAMGRIEVEFLRPATLEKLEFRLKDLNLPPINAVHFDGHGHFDQRGRRGRPGTGYLIFEDTKGRRDLVPADCIGDALKCQDVSLVVLSACQSAMLADGEEPFSSLAAGLVNYGIPNVLALSYKALVTTTRDFFRAFYHTLALGRTVCESVDEGRRALFSRTVRGRVRRQNAIVDLHLSDWFLPVVYQQSTDRPLLTNAGRKGKKPKKKPPGDLLPAPSKVGFFGRFVEMWTIESKFARGIRRLTISGLDGVGKTSLAVRIARWLEKSRQFAVSYRHSLYRGFSGP